MICLTPEVQDQEGLHSFVSVHKNHFTQMGSLFAGEIHIISVVRGLRLLDGGMILGSAFAFEMSRE